MRRTNDPWPPEDVEILKAMTAKGHSAAEIARAIGHGITRNAVCGKWDRLGIGGNVVKLTRAQRSVHTPRPANYARSVPPPPEPVVELPSLVLENGEHVTLMMVSDRTCRWPIGDPQDADFHFCGQPPRIGRPYCDGHCVKASAGKPSGVAANTFGSWT